MPKLIDINPYIGKKFGRLTILNYAGLSEKMKRRLVTCKCDCGNIINANFTDLVHNKVISCGCRHKEIYASGGNSKTHGLSKTRIYKLYHSILTRCNNPNCNHYKDYGGRNIGICEEWATDFLAFREWALNNGYSDNLTIERIDVNKGYSPDNCCWIPREKQVLNRRKTVYITYNGEKKPMSVWAKELGVSYYTLRWRKDKGFSEKEIIEGKRNMAERVDME